MAPFSIINNNTISDENVNKIVKLEVGSTVYAGTDVIEDSNIQKYPLATNIEYIIDNIKRMDIIGFLISFSTGIVNLPISELSKEGVSGSGLATGFEGPGILTIEDKKILVKAPDNFVWGYGVSYTFAIKKKDGLAIVEENKTLKILSSEDINNNTVPHDIIDSESIKKWYEKSDIGDNITLQYGLTNFSDNRNLVKPSDIKTFFGENIYNYTMKHPSGSPVMVYMHDYHENITGEYYSNLGSYPQYNDANRVYNAKQFVYAWNNTIIPPKTSSSGLDIVGFATSIDPKAPGGGASHGVCPPARALRAAVMDNGFPLPIGMNNDFEAVKFGFNPGSGIKVTNTGDEPAKIIMWTEGEGTSLVIYAKLIKYIPN